MLKRVTRKFKKQIKRKKKRDKSKEKKREQLTRNFTRKKNILHGRTNGLTTRITTRNEFKIHKRKLIKGLPIKHCIIFARTEIAYKIKKLELGLVYLSAYKKLESQSGSESVWGKKMVLHEKEVNMRF